MATRRLARAAMMIGSALVCGCSPGFVQIATPGAEVEIRYGWGRKAVITSESGPVALPPGTYRPRMITFSARQAAEGGAGGAATWTICSYYSFGELEQIRVREDETTTIQLGPPLRVTTHVRPGREAIAIDYSITGKRGEMYSPIVRRNGKAQPAPEVRIIDTEGRVLDLGRFKYG